MSDQPALSYLQAAAQGASPVGQVILLYDTVLRDFSRAKAAQAAGNIGERVRQLNHALSVIGYLQSVLDFERGGEAAKRFNQFYDVTRELILQANVKASRESFEQLIAICSKVRQAWYQADQQLAVQDPHAYGVPLNQHPRRSGSGAAAPIPMDQEPAKRRWRT